MRKTITASLLTACITATSLTVQAQELALAPGTLKGFDGISAECIVQTPDAFATGACKMLFSGASKQADKAGVVFIQAGTQVWEGVDVKDRAHLELPAGSKLTSPLRLTFFVRGAHTNDITGGFTRIALWIPAKVDGRTGKLVLWETSTIGTGPRKGLRTALIKQIVGKLATPFSALAADNKAQ